MEAKKLTKEQKDKEFVELVRTLRSLPKGKFEGMSASEIVHFIRTRSLCNARDQYLTRHG